MHADPGEFSTWRADRRSSARKRLSHYQPGRFADSLRKDGYVCIAPADWGAPVAAGLADWPVFAESWERLARDLWMGDGGGYRRRRFAAFSIADGAVSRLPHQAHYQDRLHNRLNGGVARWFSPVEPGIADHGVTTALLRIGAELANAVLGWSKPGWHAELHQFRIEAVGAGIGRPTPEGLHRDGVTGVLMMLVGRHNVSGGVTTLVEDGQFAAELQLTRPLEAVFVDDARMRHCVSPVSARDPRHPGWRDALVLTFRPSQTRFQSAFKETCHG
jgi:hypothetical protein